MNNSMKSLTKQGLLMALVVSGAGGFAYLLYTGSSIGVFFIMGITFLAFSGA